MRAVHGIQPVCVCDECHLMNQEMLEEIRCLINRHLDSRSPMGLILVIYRAVWRKLRCRLIQQSVREVMFRAN